MNNDYKDEMVVSINFTVKTDQHDTDEMISCYIPEINQYFSARTPEDVKRKASAFIKSWINFWNERNQPIIH